MIVFATEFTAAGLSAVHALYLAAADSIFSLATDASVTRLR